MPTTTHPQPELEPRPGPDRGPDRAVARREQVTLLAAAVRGVLTGLTRAVLDHFLGT